MSNDFDIKITGYSFILAVDNQTRNEEKKTFLNVEYEINNETFCEKIPMHKDRFAEIREDLHNSDVIERLRKKHF